MRYLLPSHGITWHGSQFVGNGQPMDAVKYRRQLSVSDIAHAGLISSTLLTLIVLPALYRMFTGTRADGLPSPRHTARV